MHRVPTPRFAFILVLCLAGTLIGGVKAAAAGGLAKPLVDNVLVSHDTFAAHSEPSVAENPRNQNNLIAGSKFFTDPAHYRFKIGTYYSMDGGKTWHDSGLLPGFEEYPSVSDVSIAFARNGTAYIAVLGCQAYICPGTFYRSGIFVSKSTDGGKTFSKPVTVYLDVTGATFSDKPWIAVDGTRGPHAGSVYVAWNLDPIPDPCGSSGGPDAHARPLPNIGDVQGGIAVSRSTDGGQTFSDPVVLLPFTNKVEGLGAIPAVGPNGNVSVVWAATTCSGAIDSLSVATSSDGGATFSEPRSVSHVSPLPFHLPNGAFRTTSLPTFAISPKDGTMAVAWADMRNGDADILSSRSVDGGIIWSKPERVNHDRLGNGKDQFMPALAVAPNGTFTCAWFDRRHDKNNRLINEEIAQSTDGARSFGHNFRVTAKSWDPAIDAPLPEGKTDNTFIGDYQGLAVDNHTAHPLWNDTQNGRSQEIRTAVMSERLFVRR